MIDFFNFFVYIVWRYGTLGWRGAVFSFLFFSWDILFIAICTITEPALEFQPIWGSLADGPINQLPI